MFTFLNSVLFFPTDLLNVNNWNLGRLPGQDDIVVIDDNDPNKDIIVKFDSAVNTTVGAIVSQEILEITGGTLSISNEASLNELLLSGGTLTGSGNIDTNVFNWRAGTLSGSANTTMSVGTLNISNTK